MAALTHGDAQDLVARLKRAWEKRGGITSEDRYSSPSRGPNPGGGIRRFDAA